VYYDAIYKVLIKLVDVLYFTKSEFFWKTYTIVEQPSCLTQSVGWDYNTLKASC